LRRRYIFEKRIHISEEKEEGRETERERMREND